MISFVDAEKAPDEILQQLLIRSSNRLDPELQPPSLIKGVHENSRASLRCLSWVTGAHSHQFQSALTWEPQPA